MENKINELESPKFTLDLKEWKEIENAEDVMEKNKEGKYCILSNEWVTTIIIKEGLKPEINHYKLDDVEIIGSKKVERPETVTKSIESSTLQILEDLGLDTTNKVTCTQEGIQRARGSILQNPVFWFVAKTNKPTISVMAFSNDDINHPEIKSYPVDESIIKNIENRTIAI